MDNLFISKFLVWESPKGINFFCKSLRIVVLNLRKEYKSVGKATAGMSKSLTVVLNIRERIQTLDSMLNFPSFAAKLLDRGSHSLEFCFNILPF